MSDLLLFGIGLFMPFCVYVFTHYAVNIWAWWMKYEWLNIPPFHCHKCFNFWCNIAVALFLFIATSSVVLLATDIIVTLLITLSFYFKYK